MYYSLKIDISIAWSKQSAATLYKTKNVITNVNNSQSFIRHVLSFIGLFTGASQSKISLATYS